MNQWTLNVESYFLKKCCLFFLVVSVSLFFSCLWSKKQWQSFFFGVIRLPLFFWLQTTKKTATTKFFFLCQKKTIFFFWKNKKKHQKSIKDHLKNHIKWKKWENNVRFELNEWRTSGKKSLKNFFFACHCFFGYKQPKKQWHLGLS